MSNQSPIKQLFCTVVGSSDFCARIKLYLNKYHPEIDSTGSFYNEAWATLITSKPDLLIVDLGTHLRHKDGWLRTLLENARERFKKDIHVAVVLSSPLKLLSAGDLLFMNEKSLEPSGLVDTFMALAPPEAIDAPSLEQQLANLIYLIRHDLERRSKGEPALPALGEPGWIQSLADPKSRELWMKWLPRYASYVNESPLIIGETGTGKTNLARAVHFLSQRKGSFIGITPRDFSSSELVQAELFGSVGGAYTGAVDRWGLVKSAEAGTLFIDELQSIDKDLQGKLITFIENKNYRRVGSPELHQADVRFVFASNRNLYEMMDQSILRDDFGYRLERVLLQLLPLHERRLDITAALCFGLAKIHRQRDIFYRVDGFSPEAYKTLYFQRWPGNLRQLENCVAKLVERAEMDRSSVVPIEAVSEVLEISNREFQLDRKEIYAKSGHDFSRHVLSNEVKDIHEAIEIFSEKLRENALSSCQGDQQSAAELIGDSQPLLELARRSILLSRKHESSSN